MTANGEMITVRRAVIADVSAPPCLAGWSAGTSCPDDTPWHATLPVRSSDHQGGLGAQRAGALGTGTAHPTGHHPPGRLDHRPQRLDGTGHRPRRAGRPVPADRADEHHRPDPITAGTETLWPTPGYPNACCTTPGPPGRTTPSPGPGIPTMRSGWRTACSQDRKVRTGFQ